jgi:hypothetical protein
MRGDTAGSGSTLTDSARHGLQARAHRARAMAARYQGEAARVLIEIADEFEARAAALGVDATKL